METVGILVRRDHPETLRLLEQEVGTQGVTLIALDDGTTLSGLQRVVERDSEGGNGHDAAEPAAEGDAPESLSSEG